MRPVYTEAKEGTFYSDYYDERSIPIVLLIYSLIYIVTDCVFTIYL